jgi:hypothetical protein
MLRREGGMEMDDTQRFRWFFGIDVSKETFDGCCINMKGEKLFNLSTSMDRKGFEELIQQLSGLSVSQGSALVGILKHCMDKVYTVLRSSGEESAGSKENLPPPPNFAEYTCKKRGVCYIRSRRLRVESEHKKDYQKIKEELFPVIIIYLSQLRTPLSFCLTFCKFDRFICLHYRDTC